LMPRMGDTDEQLLGLKERTTANIDATLTNLKRAAEREWVR
jgi:hypothetical protein